MWLSRKPSRVGGPSFWWEWGLGRRGKREAVVIGRWFFFVGGEDGCACWDQETARARGGEERADGRECDGEGMRKRIATKASERFF